MRKYFTIFKMSLSETFKFAYELLFRFVSYFINMFALTSVWRFIYSDGTNVIKGYTLDMMIWYMLFADTLNYATSKKVKNQIESDIKSGSIVYKVTKPYHYILYYFSIYIGDTLVRFVLYGIVSILIGLFFTGGLNINITIIELLLFFITAFLAISIQGLITITISLFSFKFEDSTPFQWIYSKFILIFGIFFPIDMFPKFLQKFLGYSPVFVTTYGPARLLLSFNMNLFFEVIIFQLIYLVIITLLSLIIYKKGVKKLNVYGG